MKTMRGFGVVAAMSVLVLGGCSGSDASVGQEGVSIDFERYELANGLDVILHVDRSDPIAAVAMTFHVGSAREVEGKTGFAHLFEHLLDRKSTRLNSSHSQQSRMPSSA